MCRAVWNGSRERPLSPRWLGVLGVAGLGLTLALWVWGVAFAKLPASGGGDGVFFFRLVEAGKVSLARWHELPLWNPYECGGVPLWDNPQSIVASPLALLLQPASTGLTIAVWAVVHTTVGFVGMWLLCRSELRSSRFAAFVAACLFAFSAPISDHVGGGHTAFASFQFAPLALFFWRRAETDRRMAIGLGLLVANTLYEGGVYPLAFMALMLAIETLTRLSSVPRTLAITKAAGIVVLVAATVGAARLIPVVDQLAHYKRPLAPETDFIDGALLRDMYLSRAHALRFGHEYVWPEYVAYTGPIVLVFVFAGILLGARHAKWLSVLGVVLFLLMLGHFAPWAPWSLLKGHVPPFVSMRVPSRFRLLLVVAIAGFVAIAVDRVPRFVASFGTGRFAEAARAVTIAVALFAAGDVASHSLDIIASTWDGPKPTPQAPSARFHLGGPGIAQFIDQPRQNRGRLECWEEWAPHAGAPLWVGDLPQAKATSPSATVRSVSRTQNSFAIDVDAPEPTTLLLNTSFARGWRASVGLAREQAHQLVVDIPAGHHEIRVWYWPVGLTLGFVLTAVGLVLSIFGLIRRPQMESRKPVKVG